MSKQNMIDIWHEYNKRYDTFSIAVNEVTKPRQYIEFIKCHVYPENNILTVAKEGLTKTLSFNPKEIPHGVKIPMPSNGKRNKKSNSGLYFLTISSNSWIRDIKETWQERYNASVDTLPTIAELYIPESFLALERSETSKTFGWFTQYYHQFRSGRIPNMILIDRETVIREEINNSLKSQTLDTYCDILDLKDQLLRIQEKIDETGCKIVDQDPANRIRQVHEAAINKMKGGGR